MVLPGRASPLLGPSAFESSVRLTPLAVCPPLQHKTQQDLQLLELVHEAELSAVGSGKKGKASAAAPAKGKGKRAAAAEPAGKGKAGVAKKRR